MRNIETFKILSGVYKYDVTSMGQQFSNKECHIGKILRGTDYVYVVKGSRLLGTEEYFIIINPDTYKYGKLFVNEETKYDMKTMLVSDEIVENITVEDINKNSYFRFSISKQKEFYLELSK